MMSVLKRVLPFILTLLVGVIVGGGLKRADRAAMPGGEVTSCKMRQRQVMLAPPPPAPPAPPSLPPSFDRDVFTPADVTRKVFISHKPHPLYTAEARRNNVTGTVRLRVVLAADGTVRDITPLTTLPDGLTEQAMAAARKIEFTPASKDGRAVSQYVTVEYNFNIY
ncbi:MAG TPA: energy transducer TonB [Pyrinomonadaceae bacterium]|nr:energy transducer TonB [Pyrinomonadaceae bacterium]